MYTLPDTAQRIGIDPEASLHHGRSTVDGLMSWNVADTLAHARVPERSRRGGRQSGRHRTLTAELMGQPFHQRAPIVLTGHPLTQTLQRVRR
jgi:hypothetical protein